MKKSINLACILQFNTTSFLSPSLELVLEKRLTRKVVISLDTLESLVFEELTALRILRTLAKLRCDIVALRT